MLACIDRSETQATLVSLPASPNLHANLHPGSPAPLTPHRFLTGSGLAKEGEAKPAPILQVRFGVDLVRRQFRRDSREDGHRQPVHELHGYLLWPLQDYPALKEWLRPKTGVFVETIGNPPALSGLEAR